MTTGRRRLTRGRLTTLVSLGFVAVLALSGCAHHTFGAHMGVAVLDRTTGAAISANGDKTFQTASIVKFDILATRLYQHQHAGTSMTANERALAFKMITQSDNNAATALFGLDNRASGL